MGQVSDVSLRKSLVRALRFVVHIEMLTRFGILPPFPTVGQGEICHSGIIASVRDENFFMGGFLREPSGVRAIWSKIESPRIIRNIPEGTIAWPMIGIFAILR